MYRDKSVFDLVAKMQFAMHTTTSTTTNNNNNNFTFPNKQTVHTLCGDQIIKAAIDGWRGIISIFM